VTRPQPGGCRRLAPAFANRTNPAADAARLPYSQIERTRRLTPLGSGRRVHPFADVPIPDSNLNQVLFGVFVLIVEYSKKFLPFFLIGLKNS